MLLDEEGTTSLTIHIVTERDWNDTVEVPAQIVPQEVAVCASHNDQLPGSGMLAAVSHRDARSVMASVSTTAESFNTAVIEFYRHLVISDARLLPPSASRGHA
jgi:hypothetical protein